MSEKLNKEGLTKVWLKVWTLVKTLTGEVDVSGKGTLQAQINNLSAKTEQCFQSASDGKTLVANAVTGKGVPTSADDTFATMADNIGKIKSNPTLQSKSAALHTGQTSVTMKPDSGYDGLSQATADITLQEKTAALSTAAQSITPDSGKVLSKVTVPAVTGNAGTGDVLSGKTFCSGSAGVNKTGAMANQGAWVGETSGNGNVAIPKGYHDGNGYVKGEGAYNAGKSAGISAAKVGTAGTGDVLSGKTFTNASTVGATGAMANKGGTTVDAGSVTQDSSYTYLGIPSSGYYSSGSKVRAKNSDLTNSLFKAGMVTSPSSAATTMINIGFKPKYIVVMYYINSSNHIECIYNENITSSLQFRTGSQYAVPYSSKSNLHIGSITDNGFTIITGDGAISRNIPIYYFAAK